jgi:hypothetical protein
MNALGGVWKKFVDLLPKPARLVGVITVVQSSGRYTVQLTGGGFVQAFGEGIYSVSDRVFISGKKIDGKSPSLTSFVIDV